MGPVMAIPAGYALAGTLAGGLGTGCAIGLASGKSSKIDSKVVQKLKNSHELLQILRKLIIQLQNEYIQAKQQAKRLQDPQVYKQLKDKAFYAFVKNISKLKFTEPIKKQEGHKYFVLIGNISSGKSSLINYACGTKLEVGLGECTQVASQVASNGLIHIWDSPGVNENFSIFDPASLSYFHTADRVFILYPDSLKSCKQIVIVMNKIKPHNTFLVRTKCDMWDSTHSKTINEEIQADLNYLKKLQNVKLPVLATSSKKPMSFQQNKQFCDLLTGRL